MHWLSEQDFTFTRGDHAEIARLVLRMRDLAGQDRPFPAEAVRELRDALRLSAVTVVERGDSLRTVTSVGNVLSVPLAVVADAADGPQIGLTDDEPPIAVLPLSGLPAALLVQSANMTPARAVELWPVAEAFAAGWHFNRAVRLSDAAADLLERVTNWPADDPDRLLCDLAETATELLDCDRASVFVRDEARKELVAAPALGVAGNTLRLPEDKGLVGQVIATREPIRIDDAYEDARFDSSTDKETGYETESILCVPMLTDDACVGALQAINKRVGHFSTADRTVLEWLAIQATAAIARVRKAEKQKRRTKSLETRAGTMPMIGESASMAKVRETIERLAPTDLPVLVLGESGTGKEVAATALHESGPRREGPFVAVNCAAIAETLLESELFGHEQGAFTDARERRAGKFELADGGTLLLDEIGDMSPGGQAKLLRVLEQKVVVRVGGSQPIPVDVRVVAATNAKLAEKVGKGEFREDLYYRLSVVTLDLTPLRERPDDVILLAEFFLERFSEQAGRASLKLSIDAKRRLQTHSWPGNIRELRNLMERVAFLAAGDEVQASDVAFILSPQREESSDVGISAELPLAEATADFQRLHIERAIKLTQGNVTAAADLLDVHRSNLYRKMRQLGMETGE